MTQKELILDEELRQMWYERPEFWSAWNKLGEICHLYSLISWPTALKIIRSFNSYPQIEEVEALLNQCLERWINSTSLQHSFRGFYMYALYRGNIFRYIFFLHLLGPTHVLPRLTYQTDRSCLPL